MSVPPNDVIAPPPPAGTPSAEEKQWALFAHLSALLGVFLTGFMFGWGAFLGPLIIWLVKKDTMPFVNDQGKEALNFNITLAIIGVVLLMLTIMTLGIGLLIALPFTVRLSHCPNGIFSRNALRRSMRRSPLSSSANSRAG